MANDEAIRQIKRSMLRRFWKKQHKLIPNSWEKIHGRITWRQFWEKRWNDDWDRFVEEQRNLPDTLE